MPFPWEVNCGRRSKAPSGARAPRDVDLPLTLDGEHDDGAPDVDRKAAVPALAERLTGVRVTESLLADATYEWGFGSGYFA
ncbi:DUF6461 domain-containing protein [Streptomyces werraensis]|uniref:DUF6461 domain-containing protein n=1 Tax=Streptomyces werraensis TaxID=68284 RepID=UPI003443A834